MTTPTDLLHVRGVMAVLGLKDVRNVYRRRARGTFPAPYTYLGNRPVWKRSDIELLRDDMTTVRAIHMRYEAERRQKAAA